MAYGIVLVLSGVVGWLLRDLADAQEPRPGSVLALGAAVVSIGGIGCLSVLMNGG